MLDNNDNVISVTQGNIFAVKSGLLLTPSLDKCGITGTRRELKAVTMLNIGQQLIISITATAHTQCIFTRHLCWHFGDDDESDWLSVTQGNIFAVKSGLLLTPSLDKCGITGTRREAILKIATNLGLQVKVGKLTLQALLDCDEIFISNSVIGIKSVSAVNKRQFTQSTVTQRLARALQKYSLKRKNKYSLKPKKIMKNFLTIVAIFALTWSYWANTLKITEPTVYHLPQGANIISTVNNLEERGVIRSPFFMRIAAKVLGFDTKLKSGYYDIVPNMSALDLLENFVSATVANRNITLIEGKTVRHYYQQLQDIKMLKPSGTFVNIMHLLGIKSPYEGIFWPDTYRVQYGDSVASVFHRSHQTMQRILAAKWKNRDKTIFFGDKKQGIA
jgi:hypothetical protein